MQNSGVEGPSIFVAHPSQHLTDYVANGDGLIAYSFLCGLAERGYVLHVAAETISIQKPLPRNVTLYPLRLKTRNRGLRLLEYSIRLRLLFRKLSRQHDFRLIVQMNPVYPGLSLALLGTSLPVLLGTYVPRWESAPAQFKDGYRGSPRWAAWARDRVVALQQRFASALLLTSPAAMNRVPAPAQNAAKIFHLPHPIDVELFRPPDSSSKVSALKHFGILFVGSVSRRKGIFDLLAVLPAVLRACPQAHLTVVGPGDDLEQVREFVAQSEHRDQISILGRFSAKLRPSFIASMLYIASRLMESPMPQHCSKRWPLGFRSSPPTQVERHSWFPLRVAGWSRQVTLQPWVRPWWKCSFLLRCVKAWASETGRRRCPFL